MADRSTPIAGLSRIIAVCNQKGGVGKTTTAINLSAALAARNLLITLIDLDPQGNASTGLGINRADRGDGSYSLLIGKRGYSAVAHPSSLPGLRIIPAEAGLSGAEIELVAVERREFRLRDAMAVMQQRDERPHYVIIDCPPSLNLLTLNALVAADAAVVPLQSEFMALEGLSQMTATIGLVQAELNPRLCLHGILLTMFDRRNNLCELVEADVRGFFNESVYQTVIPRNVRLSEAPSHGLSVLEYDAKSAGASSYIRLAEEFILRDDQLAAGRSTTTTLQGYGQ